MPESFTRQRIIPLIVAFAMFMEALDSTIINTAIPAMSRSLQISPIDLKIALISYLLSLAIFIPISGWIADKFGIKRVFMTALVIFTASSWWCGFADNLPHLIVARVLQGLGGALTLPVGRLILVRLFPRHQLISVMNKVIMIGGFGVMAGPVLGGIITQHFAWPWIFWINIPIGIFAIIMSWRYLENTPSLKVPPLDKLGFLLFGSSLAGFTFALSAFSESSLSVHVTTVIFCTAIVLFLLYLWHSRVQSHPIIKIQLLRLRTFRISMIGNLCSRLGFGGVPFLISLLLQVGFAYPPQTTGLLIAPMAMGVLLAKPATLPLLRLFGYKKLLWLNTTLASVAICAFAGIHADTALYHIVALTLLYGFAASLQYGLMNSLAYADLAQEDFSSGVSMLSTMQQLAQSFGVAISALFVSFFAQHIVSGQAVLTPLVFKYAFAAIGLITFFSSIIYCYLKPEDGQQMIELEQK